MTLRLVNTLTGTKEPFSPANANRVFALLGAHYRQPLDWSADALAQAKRCKNSV